MRARADWREVAAAVASSLPPHREACVPRWLVPGTRGLRRTLGLGRGRHYSLPLPDGGRLHVIDDGGWCYRVHWDLRDPHRDPLGHLLLDSPLIAAAGAGALTALPALAAGAAQALLGAAQGLLAAVALHAAARLLEALPH